MPKHAQPYERSSKLKFPEIVVNNFVGGFAWGLGATVGLAIFFALITLLAKNVNLVPVVGTFVSDVLNFILATNPNLNH